MPHQLSKEFFTNMNSFYFWCRPPLKINLLSFVIYREEICLYLFQLFCVNYLSKCILYKYWIGLVSLHSHTGWIFLNFATQIFRYDASTERGGGIAYSSIWMRMIVLWEWFFYENDFFMRMIFFIRMIFFDENDFFGWEWWSAEDEAHPHLFGV